MSDFCVRKRVLHGVSLWWVCQLVDGKAVAYADTFAPTGYGFKSKTRAQRCANNIEERLANKEKPHE